MIKLPHYIIKVKKLIHTPKTKTWCSLPYPNHPKGCPKNVEECSNGKYITDVINLNKSIYFVYSEFNLFKHMLKMKERHPHWTKRQCKNVLYWQSTSRKQLRERTIKAIQLTNTTYLTYCPESLGVNIYVTIQNSGFILEPIKSLKICRHISLIGFSS